jgi:hypothetical protein
VHAHLGRGKKRDLGGKATRVGGEREGGYRRRSSRRRVGATWSRAGCEGRRGGAAACSGCRASGRRSCGSRSYRSSSRPPFRPRDRRRRRPTASPKSRRRRRTSLCYDGVGTEGEPVGNFEEGEDLRFWGGRRTSQGEARNMPLADRTGGLCLQFKSKILYYYYFLITFPVIYFQQEYKFLFKFDYLSY